MTDSLHVSRYVETWLQSPFAKADNVPWEIIGNAEPLVRAALSAVDSDFDVNEKLQYIELRSSKWVAF